MVTLLLQVLAVALAAAAAYFARQTVREARLARIEDGWRELARALFELQRAAEHVVDLEDSLRQARDALRESRNPEWSRTEGGPAVYRADVGLQEARALLEEARSRLDHAVAGRYRTRDVLALRKATAAEIAQRAPAALDEIHGIQDKLLRDRGWWFRSPSPWVDRLRARSNTLAHNVVILPALRAGRRLRAAVRRRRRGP